MLRGKKRGDWRDDAAGEEGDDGNEGGNMIAF